MPSASASIMPGYNHTHSHDSELNIGTCSDVTRQFKIMPFFCFLLFVTLMIPILGLVTGYCNDFSYIFKVFKVLLEEMYEVINFRSFQIG